LGGLVCGDRADGLKLAVAVVPGIAIVALTST